MSGGHLSQMPPFFYDEAPMFSCAKSVKHSFLAALLLPLLTISWAAAADFHNAISLQGFTGLLNTPNAYVTEEGKGYALYSNQEENKWRARTPHQDNYLLSLGLYDHVEIGGRFFDAPGAGRDLSFNGKLQIPFIPRDSLLPQFAVGVQDISGGKGANLLRTYYGVASKDFWRLRLSLGYGTGPQRMEGLFGGAEFKACDWFYLVGDYDTRETNLGARIVTPHLFGYPVNLHVTVKTSVDYHPGSFEIGAGLQFPLGYTHHSTTPIELPPPVRDEALPRETSPSHPPAQATSPVPPPPQEKEGERSPGVTAGLLSLQRKLVDQGFQNLRIGTMGGSLLIVEFENSRFNQNELDAFGVVAGMAVAELPDSIRELRLISKKKNIRMLQLSAPAAPLRDFYRDAASLGELQAVLTVSETIGDDAGATYLEERGDSSLLRSSLVLYPGLKTYLGTEVAPFDYLLSLDPELYLNLWKGAVVNALWDIPLLWSDNFDDGNRFRSDRHESRMERLMLFQAIKPAPGIMALFGGGMVTHDAYGTANEAVWLLDEGRHRFRVMQLFTVDDDDRRRESYLGGYRYYHAPLETYLEATAGKFWSQDTGVMLELKRFFGDTALTVYYKNSSAEDHQNHQAVGLQVSLPLTPRRDMSQSPVQIRGSEEWSYSQESEIAKKGSWNYIGTSTGIKPVTPYNIGRVFYNRDRLTEGYVRENLLRMRDAYRTYGAGNR